MSTSPSPTSAAMMLEPFDFINGEDVYQSAYAFEDLILTSNNGTSTMEAQQIEPILDDTVPVAMVECENRVIKSGYLWKEGSRVKSWKWRYFILQYHSGLECATLSYFAKEASLKKQSKPLGIIDFYEVVNVQLNPDCTKNNHGITLSIIDKELRRFHVAAETETDCEEWLKALKEGKALSKRSAAEELTSYANINNKIFDTVFGLLGQKKVESPIPEDIRLKVECLRRIKQFTNKEIEFEYREESCLSFEDIPEQFHVGLDFHIISNYLKTLSDRIVTYVTQSSKHLAAFCEVVSAKKLIFEFDASIATFVRTLIIDGAIVIRVAPRNFMMRVDETGYELPNEIAGRSSTLLPISISHGILSCSVIHDDILKELSALCGPLSFACNYESLYKAEGIEPMNKENLPTIITKYFNALAEKLKEFLRDPLKKEAYLELTKSQQIGFSWNDQIPTCTTRLMAGILFMQVNPAKFGSEVDTIGDNLLTTYGTSTSHKLPLAVRIGIRDNQSNLTGYLRNIEEATGVQFRFVVDYESLYFDEEVPKNQLMNLAHTAINGYLYHFSQQVVKLCQDERMKQELITDTSQSKTIELTFGEIDHGYMQTIIYNDGRIVITTPASKFGSAVQETGSDLRHYYEL